MRSTCGGSRRRPGRSSPDRARRPDRTADLSAALDALGRRPHTQIALPGGPVELSGHAVREIAAAVAACLDNIDTHVGPDAPAWVLLLDLGDEVEVTVRDEGPGIPAGRLEEAASSGRLGVSSSIRGRIADLGGTAELVTAPAQGTEWELTLPRAT